MTKKSVLILGIMIFNLFSCKESIQDRSFRIFNEGVKLTLVAGDTIAKGDQVAGKKFYELAIKKFKETLLIDPHHEGAVSGIGLSYYLIRNNEDAIYWFNRAIEMDPNMSANYQFLGLSQINKGMMTEGQKYIEKAIQMDGSKEMKSNTVENLVEIGNLAYSYGADYEKEGDAAKGTEYRIFAIRVLLMAYTYSNKDSTIGRAVEDYTYRMNIDTLTTIVKEKLK